MEKQEQIINNAFKFLSRNDLVIINKVITYPFLDKKDLENNSVYEMYLTKSFSDNKMYVYIGYKSEYDWDSEIKISSDYNQKLTDLFNKTYIVLAEKQQPR